MILEGILNFEFQILFINISDSNRESNLRDVIKYSESTSFV
jgi:hypothetical protein